MIQTPSVTSIDGIDLYHYHVGFEYEVGTTIGSLLLLHGWAEPVVDGQPALVVPLEEFEPDAKQRPNPPNLRREFSSPAPDRSVVSAAASRRRRRTRNTSRRP